MMSPRKNSNGVTSTVRQAMGKPPAAGNRHNRLRGDMEHASHQTAVNRYMRPESIQREVEADRRFYRSMVIIAIASGAALVLLKLL